MCPFSANQYRYHIIEHMHTTYGDAFLALKEKKEYKKVSEIRQRTYENCELATEKFASQGFFIGTHHMTLTQLQLKKNYLNI